MLAVKGDKTR